MKPRREKDIQLAILKYLRAIGCCAGKTKTLGVKYGEVYRYDHYTFIGFPDITCFFKNKLYFIEVKTGRNRQTPEQKEFENLCLSAGITYILAYSLDDVIEIIK